MRPQRLSEIASVVEGTLRGDDTVVTGVSSNSREVREGDLFAAISGERADGHDFLEDAASRGAAGALVSRDVRTAVPRVIVADAVTALLTLAEHERESIEARVIGITGSTGKTSVKDLTAGVLSTRFRVTASPRSFNTEVGVPLTLMNAPADAEALVLEMGSRGLGQVAALCRVAGPEVGVVTGVGPAHMEMFGSLEVVADAKAELVEALPERGTAVLNGDDPVVSGFDTRTPARVMRYGTAATADIRAEDLELDPLGRPSFTLRTPAGEERVELPMSGEHMAMNALAAAAVGVALGLTPSECAAGLKDVRISPWRMELLEGAGGIRILNDAYNANPTSTAAALKAAKWIAGDGRCIAVLGEMAELGEESDQHHERIGELAVRLRIDHLVVVGHEARRIAIGAVREGVEPDLVTTVADIEEAADVVRGLAREGDVVLLKGSRVAGLERLAEALR
ncbi:MAG: UDP-N-acetylmuramoyl-tripeptide--D-alanyl-D-alanine ligase [Actinomycetota bacterium]|nr:UDP-N-acetylmuramoyl-tripeptide--D-alanyl-D-alanine ligase [Actinomycetota bacterium]